MTPDTLQAYHFTGTHLRDGRPVPKVGEWLRHTGPVVPCQSGLHASLHPSDALMYAPGNHLHLVEVEGDIQHHGGDKLVARNRRILKSFDAEKLLREFARWNALQVIHLWKAPQVVRDYLETGDEKLREAAYAAAYTAAYDAAIYAAYAAARAAARAAADAASYAAARTTALAAARDKFKQMVDEAFDKLP